MKEGDLVKIKWITYAQRVGLTYAQKRRAQQTGFPPGGTHGLVINKLDPTGVIPIGFVAVVEVMFPERPGRFVSFAETDLEVVT
jgi:hypothetical protein